MKKQGLRVFHSWHTAYMAQDTKQKKKHTWPTLTRKREHLAHSYLAQIPSTKKQREPGPNRYQATNFKVNQLTVKRAKYKIQTCSTKRLSNSYVCTIFCATSKRKIHKIWLFFTLGHSLQNKSEHVPIAV